MPTNLRRHRPRGMRPPREAPATSERGQATLCGTAGHPAFRQRREGTTDRGTVAPAQLPPQTKAECRQRAGWNSCRLSTRSQRPVRRGPSVRPSWAPPPGRPRMARADQWSRPRCVRSPRRGAMAGGVFVFCFFNLGRRTGLRGPRGRGQQTQLPFVHLSGLALGSWQPSGNLRARAGLTWPRPFKNV